MSGRRPAAAGRAGRAWAGLGVLLVVALVAAGCGSRDESAPVAAPSESSPFADCAGLTQAVATPGAAAAGETAASATPGAPATGETAAGEATSGAPATGETAAGEGGVVGAAGVASGTASAPSGRAESVLAGIELPCFTGDASVRLGDVRGPAVINLWASWCRPCRDELPLLQELADRTAGRLHVAGVDTGDEKGAAASFAGARDISMPTLYDRERKVLASLGRMTLPITVFLDERGNEYVHTLPVKTPAEMVDLVREHTGVVVMP